MRVSGIQAMLEMLAEAGVPYLFGNPGTTELPLMDALSADPRIRYILGLQEVPVVAMADGYAQASGRLGVVNLHISCGLGNAMGMIYNAHREGTPLLITAGQQDRRLKFEEPILVSDMVSVVRPWTKLALEVDRVEDLPSAMRRLMQTALAPPRGPVFLSLPMDLQAELAELDLTPAAPLDPHVRPARAALEAAALVLAQAERPAILAGSRLAELGAIEPMVRLAELLGAPVYSECLATHGRLGFPATHPLYGQTLRRWSPETRAQLAEFDVLLVAGMDLLRQYVYHEPARALPDDVRIVHVDEDPRQLNKNYPLAAAVWGHPREGLDELAMLVAQRQSPEQRAAAQTRTDHWTQLHTEERGRLLALADAVRTARPLSPVTFMEAIARVLPPNAAVVEEAVTTTNTLLERFGALGDPTGVFGHRGWSLGWGLGFAVGVKLAWPDRPVLALLGEGAAMYGIQGLWTAAHLKLPVTFVICNNAQYKILKAGSLQLSLPEALAGRFTGFDLCSPEIDFVGLARALGVEARRITEPDELSSALAESLAGDQPRLFDVPIDRELPKDW